MDHHCTFIGNCIGHANKKYFVLLMLYITLMMMFAAQGTSPLDFINNPHVASEVVKTLVGSFGLVLVAPLTALVSALIFGNRKSDSI